MASSQRKQIMAEGERYTVTFRRGLPPQARLQRALGATRDCAPRVRYEKHGSSLAAGCLHLYLRISLQGRATPTSTTILNNKGDILNKLNSELLELFKIIIDFILKIPQLNQLFFRWACVDRKIKSEYSAVFLEY